MHFLRGTQAEADAGIVLIAGLVLLCLVVLVACAATGTSLGGL
ncbi:MAG TPA: hypothetical protein PKZ84_06750 [Anaerolineae bacterium]|nr:hypothetical protein [Anaerolineae bacterium]HQI83386.1 hypothetical protein [Anaerolineae bacterium]